MKNNKKVKQNPPALKPDLSLTVLAVKKEKRFGVVTKKKMKFVFWLGFILSGLTLLWSLSLFAQISKVPHWINFQTVLSDPAGIPLADGFYDVTFRVLDLEGAELYREAQKVESFQGVASVMVGAKGNLDPELFKPGTPRFLGVEVLGQTGENILEIVSVPYSYFAEEALRVAPQSISAQSIQLQSITYDHLSEEVSQTILSQITPALLPVALVYQDELDVALLGAQMGAQNYVDRQVVQLRDILEQSLNQINASQSADLDGLRGEVADLSTQVNSTPQIRAWGVVTISGGNPQLAAGNNIASVARLADGIFQVVFSNPVSSPYAITGNVMREGGILSSTSLVIDGDNQNNNSFVVATSNKDGPSMFPFHFSVVR